MKAWSAWLPDILSWVPGCPNVTAQHEIKRAAHAFFEQSRAWRAVLDPLELDAGEPELRVLADDATSEIVRIEHASLGSAPLDCLSLEGAAAEFGADWAAQTGVPSAVSALTALSIRLIPYPIEAPTDSLVLTVSLKPSESATGIPDDLYAKYREQVCGGAKARLLMMPDKPWTNLELGASLDARFLSDVAAARVSAARAFGRGHIASAPVWC